MGTVRCGVVVEIWAWVETRRSKAEETLGRTCVGWGWGAVWVEWIEGEDGDGDAMAVWMSLERRMEMGRV